MNQLILTIALLLSLSNGKAQSTFTVLNNQQNIYLFVPNPIAYSKYDVSPHEIKMVPRDGKLDTINEVMYWTPQAWSSVLFIKQKIGNQWKIVDSIEAGPRRVIPDYFGVEPRPKGWPHDYPHLLHFSHLEFILPIEVSHIPIDSLCRVLYFDVIMLDSNFTEMDTACYVTADKPEELKRILKNNSLIYAVRFENIYYECKIWTEDRKYHISSIPTSLNWCVVR